MKKVFALALLLGLGMMVGCGEPEKPKGTAKGTQAVAKDTAKDTGTPAPAPAKDTTKKD